MIYERKRIRYFIYIVVVILLGLGSRKYSYTLPDWMALYIGDVLWGLMIYLMFGFLFSKKSRLYIAIVAAVFSTSIEISQLYHSPWIDRIRKTRIGGLILGYGFLWSDIFCYIVGISIGVILETYLTRYETL